MIVSQWASTPVPRLLDCASMRYALALSALALAACQTATTDVPEQLEAPREARSSTCGATEASASLGQPVSVIDASAYPRTTRFIFPGMPVTLDYNPERLNFDLDGAGRIVRTWCG